jgi:hypothetical protein
MNLNFTDGEEPPENGEIHDDEMDEDHIHPMSPSRKRKASAQDHPLAREGTDRATLANKSLIWKQLEQLATAIATLDTFQELVDEIEA